MPNLELIFENKIDILNVENNKNTVLPNLFEDNKIFLGWNFQKDSDAGFMNFKPQVDTTLFAVFTDKPAYILRSHFKKVPLDAKDRRCQFRRYAVDLYLANAKANSGEFKLQNVNDILYYFNNIAEDGVKLFVNAETDERGGAYNGTAYFTTDGISVRWESEKTLDATEKPIKIATLLLCFGKWGMEYGEIERLNSDEIIRPDDEFVASIGGQKALVSANFYEGTELLEEKPYTNPALLTVTDETQPMDYDFGPLLSRFAVLSDSHIGERYGFANYDWMYGVFTHLENINKTKPLDFVVQLGDNIDDGYAKTYQADYEKYLEVFDKFSLCDNLNPAENIKAGKIPHYEIKGNHDTALDLRFFSKKLWFSQNEKGEKVAYIAFFAKYGGYPAVRDLGVSYKSFGIITDDMVDFVEESVKTAKTQGAKKIVLCSHFGIAQDLEAPILPETGLSKIENICTKNKIKLFLSGHEHNKNYTLREYNGIYDYDAAMTKEKYAVFEIYENFAKVYIYNTLDNSLDRIDVIDI